MSTETQDQLQSDRERQGLLGVIHNSTEIVRHDLQDYAKWDLAVPHISYGVKREWVDDNVGAYLGQTQGYGEIFVLDSRNDTVYSFADTTLRPGLAQARLGADFAASIDDVRRMPRGGSPIISGFSRSGDSIMLYATAAVVPLSRKVGLPPGPTSLLVLGQEFDDGLLGELAAELRLRDVRITFDAPPAGTANIPLIGEAGRSVGWVTWKPLRPGTALREHLAPWLAALALLAFLSAGLILRYGRRAIEALRQSEMRARHHAHHDLLTGLPNRRALMADITERLAARQPLSLLCIDLDGFKDANDVYGHAAGDLLLKEAARRIQAAARDALVARAGGDEFAVLLPLRDDAEIARLCEATLQLFRAPFAIGAYRITLGVSIGCAHEAAARPEGQEELVRQADVAMYAAKADGKNCARNYAPELDEGHLLRLRLEKDLQASVEAKEIYVHFQPIVDAADHTTIAVEALARWSHPDHGDVPPDVFIPLAEMSGLINAIGREVLYQACRAIGDVDLLLAVNLSPAQFWDRELLVDIGTILHETGFPPHRLELEITENLLLRRPEAASDVIDGLRAMGIRIALDDFGTGFASIGYLQRLKLDRIKVDKAFIASIGSDRKARAMLMSIVGLARASDLEVSAEGVETAMQANIARLAGCNRLQGWLFGRPAPLDDLRRTLTERSRSADDASASLPRKL